jgi:CRISPR system Cascade subunit CasD
MSTGCLALQLTAPLQSWGLVSRSNRRDGGLEPSKSGVVGMLAAALGRRRDEPIDELAQLRMTVRVDREGEVVDDFQTIGAGYTNDPVWPGGGMWTADGKLKRDQRISHRLYLADAAFLVVLEGDLPTLVASFRAVRSPEFQLALGRRACPPAEPLARCAPANVKLRDVLERYPRIRRGTAPTSLRVVRELSPLEISQADELRPDQPIGVLAERRFGPRPVRHEVIAGPVT